MTTNAQALTILTLGAALTAAPAQTAQTTAAPPALSSTEQMINDIKNPAPWMNWGGDFRVRDESFDNILTLTPHPGTGPGQNPGATLHQQDYLRFRARVWTTITPMEDLNFNARLTDEAREWLKPAGYTPYRGQSGLDLREGIIDSLNVQWKNIAQQPAKVVVGRQDVFLGDGWLTGDGTPQDGSWTYFLDAARLTYELKDQHTTIEVLGILQDAKDEAWLPTINNQNYYLTEQNEKGAILWVANKSVPAVNVDGYFFYKHDDKVNAFSPDNPAPPGGDNADIYTLGGRLSGVLANNWKYSVEGAYQFGQKQDPGLNANGANAVLSPSAQTTGFRDLRAFGATAKLSYLFKDRLNNQISLNYEFLSGDDRNTKNDEAFDNLWGRWPRWSEIGLYSSAAEFAGKIGNECNLHRIGPSWSFTPARNLDFSAAYYALFAEQDVATRGATTLFAGNENTVNGLYTDHGLFRGHFLQAVLKYKFSKHAVGHLWAEFELPGNYYASRSAWYFLRPEISFSF